MACHTIHGLNSMYLRPSALHLHINSQVARTDCTRARMHARTARTARTQEKISAIRQARIKEETKAKLIHRRDVNTMEVFVWCLRRIAAVSISVLCATVSCLWLIRLRRAVLTAASGWIRSTRAFFQVLCCYFENPEERN
jgi:hypothetical protein